MYGTVYKIISYFSLFLQRCIERGILYIIISSWLSKAVSFFGSLVLVKLLTKTDFGILCYCENFCHYVSLFIGFGLAKGLMRYIVLSSEYSCKKALFHYALRRGSYWNLLLIFLSFIFLSFYSHPIKFEQFEILFIFLLLSILFLYCEEISLSSLRALYANKVYAYYSFVIVAITILSRISGAYFGGIFGVTAFKFVFDVLLGLLGVFVLEKFFFNGVKAEKVDKQFLREYNNFSLQMMFTDGLWAIFMINDLFILGQIVGNAQIVADYKVACVLPVNLSILISSVGIFVSPYFVRWSQQKNVQAIRKYLIVGITLTCLVTGIACIICYVFSADLIQLLFGQKYLSAIPIMRVLLFASFINNGLRFFLANALSSIGQQKLNLMVAIVGVVVQIIADILLINKYGIIGAAWSNVFVYFVMTVLLYCSGIKVFVGRKGWRPL